MCSLGNFKPFDQTNEGLLSATTLTVPSFSGGRRFGTVQFSEVPNPLQNDGAVNFGGLARRPFLAGKRSEPAPEPAPAEKPWEPVVTVTTGTAESSLPQGAADIKKRRSGGLSSQLGINT